MCEQIVWLGFFGSAVAYLAFEVKYCNFLQDSKNQPQNNLSVLPYTVSQYHAFQRSLKVKSQSEIL